MPLKLRAATHGGAVVLMSALLFSACLVPDVELVDQFPGGGGATATGGKASSAGSPGASGSQNEGGGEEPGAAGRNAGGNEAGGSAGNTSGGTAQGGSAGSGMSGSCNDVAAYVCDNFEDQLSSQWPPGTAPADIVDAPSGNQGVPEQNTLTRVLDIDTWVCVQLRVDLLTHTFDASVVVPGDGPVALPVLDKDPTPGQDELWNTSFPDWTANGGVLIFSEAGVYQEFDDVLVGDYDAETLCERFVAFDAN